MTEELDARVVARDRGVPFAHQPGLHSCKEVGEPKRHLLLLEVVAKVGGNVRCLVGGDTAVRKHELKIDTGTQFGEAVQLVPDLLQLTIVVSQRAGSEGLDHGERVGDDDGVAGARPARAAAAAETAESGEGCEALGAERACAASRRKYDDVLGVY